MMRIVFGHNSYVVKRIQPKEIGLFQDEFKNAEIQLRQKYAHLYFIPIFPLGQIWVMKREGKLFELHPEFKNKIKLLHPSYGVHFGAFALPLLALLGFGIYSVTESISSYQSEKHYQAQLITDGNALGKRLDSVDNKNTFLVFDGENSGDFFYKVLKVEGSKIMLAKIEKNLGEVGDSYYSFPENVRAFIFSKNNELKDGVWVDKDEIKKSIQLKEDSPFKEFKDLTDGEKLQFKEILKFNDVYFVEKTDENAKTEFYAEYENYGMDAVLDSLVPDNKKEDWKLSKHHNIIFGDKFAVKTESQNGATLYYHTTEDKNQHQLKLYGTRIE